MSARSNVLVVDDEFGARESMKMILNDHFDVSTADSGNKAIQLVKQRDFDVVLLDIRMPDMTGIEVLQHIKEQEPSPEVMMVTAYAALDTVQEALRLGAYDYIEKPFKSFDYLRDVVSKGVERKIKTSKTMQLAKEFEEIKKQIIQLEKMSSLGQMASEVIHELATPITGMLVYSELLLEQECDDIIKNSLRKIKSEAERSQNIIRNILTFARKPEKIKSIININEVVLKTIDIKMHHFKIDNIQYTYDLDPNLPDTLADFNQIQHVLINIANNAQDAMKSHEGKRQLSITTTHDSKLIFVAISN
ncbi:MAG: Response regulator, partial [Candidatus Poribacteria bacterium]|nr:Response regulator [Candidatus Poribacteria bacterium]